MPTWLAAVIMLLALAGIVSARKYLRSRRALQILCTVFCIFLALACAVYIGLNAEDARAAGISDNARARGERGRDRRRVAAHSRRRTSVPGFPPCGAAD